MKQIERILVRRKSLIIVSTPETGKPTGKEQQALLVAMMKNVQSLGFTFSQDLFNTLLLYSPSELEAFYFDLLPELKTLVGADVVYNPMYPNFPKQVMEIDAVELFINAIAHYWSFGKLLPSYQADERLPLIDNPKYTILSIGKQDDILQIFKYLLSSKTSLSEQDKSDIEQIMDNCSNYTVYLPDDIPLKENVAFLTNLLTKRGSDVDVMQKYCKTATDVLRVITAFSNGDISLAENTEYRSLSRKERRSIMGALEAIASHNDVLEDMYRYKERWLRVAEFIHPSEFKTRYPKAASAFYGLRNNKKPLMFMGKVESAINDQNIKEAVQLLKTRPGEFARRLDKLLRDTDDAEWVLNQFSEVATLVAAPVLLQISAYFKSKSKGADDIRVFFPKGKTAKVAFIENAVKQLSPQLCMEVVKVCNDAIFSQFKDKKPLGSVYVDPALKNYLVPFSQRSASSTSKNYVRGSRLPIKKDTQAIRAFIWWTNNRAESHYHSSRVDIDLSAAIYDENWNFVSHISYTNLRSSKPKAYHSGDIVDGGPSNGNGVAEFLDVDIQSASKVGRYIVYQIYSFTGQSFKDLRNCRFGWMERENVHSGEIFEPSTVQMISSVQTDATVAVPVIFDCLEKKAIWCDIQLSIGRGYNNNVENNLNRVTATCYALTHMHKANLYELAKLNALARGRLTNNRNGADIIFSNDTTPPCEVIEEIDPETGETKSVIKARSDIPIITAFDTDYIMGELL